MSNNNNNAAEYNAEARMRMKVYKRDTLGTLGQSRSNEKLAYVGFFNINTNLS